MPTAPNKTLTGNFNEKSELNIEEKLNRDIAEFNEPDQLAFRDLLQRQDIAMNHLLDKLAEEKPREIERLVRDIIDQNRREKGEHLRPKFLPTDRESLTESARIEATQKIEIIHKRKIDIAGTRFLEEKVRFVQSVKFRYEYNQKSQVQTNSQSQSKTHKRR